MHSPRMMMHRRTMNMHGCSTELQIAAIFSQVFAQREKNSLKYGSLFPDYLLILRVGVFLWGFPHFPYFIKQYFIHLDYMGDFWPSCQGPSCPKLGLRGMLGLINPPLSNIVYLVIFPNLGSYYHYTIVCGTHVGVICHLLHLHAWFYVPLGPIPTL